MKSPEIKEKEQLNFWRDKLVLDWKYLENLSSANLWEDEKSYTW